MTRKGFQLFYAADGAAGAGAGAGTVDEKAAADKKTADDTAAANAKAADDKKTADDKAAADKKAADDKAAADKAAADAKAKENQAPEKYELKVGKDAATFVDDDDLKTIEKVARDKGMTNDQAQALVDGRASAQLEQSAAFRAITEADADLGGDKLTETTRLVKVAMDKIYPAGTKDGDEFRKMLQKTGYGNNRLIVKHFRDLGRQMDEDSPGVAGSAGSGKGKDAASVLYDNPASKQP
jgi:hypothetical protein